MYVPNDYCDQPLQEPEGTDERAPTVYRILRGWDITSEAGCEEFFLCAPCAKGKDPAERLTDRAALNHRGEYCADCDVEFF